MDKRFALSIIIMIVIGISCSKTSTDKKIEIVYNKSFGMTNVYMCYTKTDDYDEMKNFGENLVEDNFVAFVYFYRDKNKIIDIRNYENLDDALPDQGYIAKLDKSPGLGITFEK